MTMGDTPFATVVFYGVDEDVPIVEVQRSGAEVLAVRMLGSKIEVEVFPDLLESIRTRDGFEQLMAAASAGLSRLGVLIGAIPSPKNDRE